MELKCKVCGGNAQFTIHPPHKEKGDYCGKCFADTEYERDKQRYIEEQQRPGTER